MQSHPHLTYRPDIDGLRGIAVIAIILFHAFPHLLPGGFAGVDVFFVISGFLISGIILKDIQNGTFTFAGFYARRIRRIFPALFLVLLVCLAVGWFILLPGEYRKLGTHTAGGAAFVSNMMLARESGYFDDAARVKPLLHLWSLGIEEQFYLVWPVLLVLLRKRLKLVLPAICAIASLSFLLDLIFVMRYPAVVFFLPITRAWELMLGSGLACTTLTRTRDFPQSQILRDVLSGFGCLLIATCLLFLDEGKVFPGPWTLLPTIGTCLLIGAGPQAWLNRHLLAFSALVRVGLISYPLYLWHWPMLVFGRIISESDLALPRMQMRLLKAGAVAICVCAAWITWRYWETPIRRSNRILGYGTAQALVAAMAALTLFGVFASTNLVGPRLNGVYLEMVADAVEDWNFPAAADNYKKLEFRTTRIGSNASRMSLFAGDSHIEQYWARVNAAIKAHPELPSAIFAGYSGCPPLPALNIDELGYRCSQFYDYWRQQAEAPGVKTIVIGAYWEAYFIGEFGTQPLTPRAFVNRLGQRTGSEDIERTWKEFETDISAFVRAGKRVVIVSSNPASATFNPLRAVHRFRPFEPYRLESVDEDAFHRFIAPVESKLIQIANATGAALVQPLDYLCRDRRCPATDQNGTPLYKDADHLRPSTAIERATFIDAMLQP